MKKLQTLLLVIILGLIFPAILFAGASIPGVIEDPIIDPIDPDPVTMTVDGQLKFNLTYSEPIFVDGTTEDPQNNIAHIDFQLLYDGIPNLNTIQQIKFKIKYPTNKVELVNCYADATHWNGYAIEPTNTSYSGGYTYKSYRLYNGSVTLQPTYTTYASLEFKALCQEEFPGSDIEFIDENDVSFVTDINNNEFSPPTGDPDSWSGGHIFLADYTGSFTIENVTDVYMGQENVEVTVSGTTNFFIFGIQQYISYDATRLEFVEGYVNTDLFDDLNSSCGIVDNEVNPGYISVYLYNDISITDPTHFIPDDDVLYTLKFNVKSEYEGVPLEDDALAFIDFTEPTGGLIYYTFAYYPHSEDFYHCYDLSQSIPYESYVSGGITVPQYEANLKLAFKEINPSPDKSGNDVLRFDLSMTNNFPAGNPTGSGGIDVVLKDRDYLTFGNALNYPDDFNFWAVHEDGNDGFDYASIRQLTGGTTNFRMPNDNYENGHLMDIDFNLFGWYEPATYADRFIYPQFACSYFNAIGQPGATMHVDDYNGYITQDYETCTGDNNKISLEIVPYEIPAFEVYGQTIVSDNVYTFQNLYIRANVDITSFSFVLTVTSSGWCVSCLDPSSNVNIETIGDKTYLVSSGPGYFKPASGDNLIKVMDMALSIPNPCVKSYHVYTTPRFSDITMTGQIGGVTVPDVMIFEHEGTVGGKCNNYVGGCGSGMYAIQCAAVYDYGLKTTTETEPENLLPTDFTLNQNHPNPFNPTTDIAYYLPVTSQVRIDIYNILGQNIITLVDGVMEAGLHQIQWDGTNSSGGKVASGVYLYNMQAGEFNKSKKMILMK
ncbi:MAG: FlgD immunoglobulin-like domain containing protein [Candidatus Zixiibacteriota bacterium]